MSRFRFNRRCWNPSSSTITWTPLSFTNRPAPRILSSSTATTAGGTLMLICAGSSPTSAVSCPDTRTYPDVVRPSPRLRMPTFLPSAISHCAISSTSCVFPVPPAEILQTQMPGTAAVAADSIPRSYATLRNRTTPPYSHPSGTRRKRRTDVSGYCENTLGDGARGSRSAEKSTNLAKVLAHCQKTLFVFQDLHCSLCHSTG